MNRKICLCLLICGGSWTFTAPHGRLVAADPPADTKTDKAETQYPGEMPPEWAAWMKYASPGEHHEHLKVFAGSWNTLVRHQMSPDSPVVESRGTSHIRWILDGRFLLQELEGDGMMGKKFKGLGIMGYDNYKKKYTGVWMDNMGTAVMTSLGTCDGAGKTFQMYGEYQDPASGKLKEFTAETRIINENEYVEEMYDTTADGKRFKTIEVTYTRRDAS